jgi:hypothetical protein
MLRLCLGVEFWRGREEKERLGKMSTFVWEFKKIRKGFGGFWGAYFIQF